MLQFIGGVVLWRIFVSGLVAVIVQPMSVPGVFVVYFTPCFRSLSSSLTWSGCLVG